MEEVDALTMKTQEDLNEADLDTMGETHHGTNEVVLLILGRVLPAQGSPLDKAQREMIFHLRCTIQDKVCNLITSEAS